MPTLPSFIRSLIPSNSQSQNSNDPSGSVSDQDSDIIPAGTVTIVQQQQQQIPTINKPSNNNIQMERVTELSSMNMKPLALNAVTPRGEEPKSEPFPPVAVQPMEMNSAAKSSTAPPPPPAEETGVQRSKSKRFSKQNNNNMGAANKERSEAYNAFWRKLLGISPRGDKGKGRGEGGASA
ncbi:hypothetical protein QBC32DRAFT_338099 [Pseudoneurospora amorphoporcata]|uniref:Uncharacterized protein n=1 Tax=Pseudoneurospora amorphoporcata TaxID=241081 RepID=A0AAN6SHE0_9PEZI|nr:hypothetical protein QBC32DRAFT_338099 [Pseudoneurospora amorphoporcata]